MAIMFVHESDCGADPEAAAWKFEQMFVCESIDPLRLLLKAEEEVQWDTWFPDPTYH